MAAELTKVIYVYYIIIYVYERNIIEWDNTNSNFFSKKSHLISKSNFFCYQHFEIKHKILYVYLFTQSLLKWINIFKN